MNWGKNILKSFMNAFKKMCKIRLIMIIKVKLYDKKNFRTKLRKNTKIINLKWRTFNSHIEV